MNTKVVILIAIVLLAALWIGKNLFSGGGDQVQPLPQTSSPVPPPLGQPGQPGALTTQPPGDPPPGKVWSPEHGHWHDAPPGQNSATGQGTITTRSVGTPQPPGDPPPGKVWSPEHGHWHDAPPGQAASETSGTAP